MYERSATRIGWLVACCRILETFDDGLQTCQGDATMTIYGTYCLATAVVTYDDSDWTEELDHLNAIIVEGTDAADCELL